MYNFAITAKKASLPLLIVVVAQAAIATLKAQGVELDENIVWSAVTASYGGFLGLKNWLKNRKKAA